MRSLRITNIFQSRVGVRWQRVCGLLVIVAAASMLSVKLLLAVYAAAGDLDPSFGNGGKVEITYSADAAQVRLQPDGKMLIPLMSYFGDACVGNIGISFSTIARLNADGSLDSTFGTNGKSVAPSYSLVGSARATHVALQSDGRILVGSQRGSCEYFFLHRLTNNGQLDTTYGDNGIVLDTISPAKIFDMVIQGDKLLVAGRYYNYLTQTWMGMIRRYNSNGSLDLTFGNGNGVKLVSQMSELTSIALAPGKIIVLGHSSPTATNVFTIGPTLPYTLARFNEDGTLDSTFGANGFFLSSAFNFANKLVRTRAGKLIVAGAQRQPHSTDNYAALFGHLADGSADQAFGVNGMAKSTSNSAWNALALDTLSFTDKIVAVGTNGNGLAGRFNSDGTLDTSFGNQGLSTTTFSTTPAYYFGVAINAAGIVAAGGHPGSPVIGAPPAPILARYMR